MVAERYLKEPQIVFESWRQHYNRVRGPTPRWVPAAPAVERLAAHISALAPTVAGHWAV